MNIGIIGSARGEIFFRIVVDFQTRSSLVHRAAHVKRLQITLSKGIKYGQVHVDFAKCPGHLAPFVA